MSTVEFESLLRRVKKCNICQDYLPQGIRPILQISPEARILIAGQAPGRKVHTSGIPFDDASGERLRKWMDVTQEIFYDSSKIAILPMGFCYPGTGQKGDLPPRPECAPAWRKLLLEQLSNLKLTLVVGRYAQAYHFSQKNATLTTLVKLWKNHPSDKILLPHPSPRNNIWLSKNPWFEQELVPKLQKRVFKILSS